MNYCLDYDRMRVIIIDCINFTKGDFYGCTSS